ncbi:unnamed protein product, partial [Prorocentrum cordatum]
GGPRGGPWEASAAGRPCSARAEGAPRTAPSCRSPGQSGPCPRASTLRMRPRRSSRILTVDGESDLRQFLKISNPVWSISRRGGGNDINRVIEKLKCIGVTDAGDLLSRVVTNRINGDLTDAGFTRFSQDTLESIRKQGSFVRAVQTLTEAGFRQTGDFAKVPRLLSSRRAPPSRDGSRSLSRPSSEPAGHGEERRRAGRSGGTSAAARPVTPSASASPSAAGGLGREASVTDHFPIPPSERAASAGRAGADVMPGALWSASVVAAASPEAPSPAPEGGAGSAPLKRVCLRGAGRGPHGVRRPATCEHQRRRLASAARPGSVDGTVSRRSAEDTAHTANRTSPRPRSEQDSCGEEERQDLPMQIEHLRKKVGDMDQRLHEEMSCGGSAASWCALRCSDSLLHQAEEVLREQQDHQERRELGRIMDREGLVSPLRKVIAGNVRARLMEEQKEDDAEAYAVAQKCTNIRKQLTHMANSRRELALLKRAVDGSRDFGVELALLKSELKTPLVRHDMHPEERASPTAALADTCSVAKDVQPVFLLSALPSYDMAFS